MRCAISQMRWPINIWASWMRGTDVDGIQRAISAISASGPLSPMRATVLAPICLAARIASSTFGERPLVLRPMTSITTGHKVGQKHRWKNWPGGHLGALVPCCRGTNDKKMVLGARLGMARPPVLQLSAGSGARLTFCDSCSLPESGPPSCARAGRQSPWPRWSSQTPCPSPQTASWW